MKKNKLQEKLLDTALDNDVEPKLRCSVPPTYADAVNVHKRRRTNTRKFIKDADELSKRKVKEGKVLPENKKNNTGKLTLDENLFESFSSVHNDVTKRRKAKKLAESLAKKSKKSLVEKTAKPENLDPFDQVQDELRGEYTNKIAKSRTMNPKKGQDRYADDQIVIRPRDGYIEVMANNDKELAFAKSVAKKYKVPFTATKYNSHYNPYKVGIRMKFDNVNESYKMKKHNRKLQENKDKDYKTAEKFGVLNSIKKFESDLLKIDGVVDVDFDLDGYYDNMHDIIFLTKYDLPQSLETKDYFIKRKSMVKDILNVAKKYGLHRTQDRIEDYGEWLYFVTEFDKNNKYFNSSKSESYKMKKYNRRLQEADRETYSNLDRAFSRARERGLKPVDYAPVKGIKPTINRARFNKSGRPEDESELDAYYSDTDKGLIHHDMKRLRNKAGDIKFSDYEDDAFGEELDTEVEDLTNNFTRDEGSIRTYTREDARYIMRLLRRYYKYVTISDGRMSNDESLSWVVSYSDPKNLGESFRRNKKKSSKKLVEKKVLNEGPGAGYTLSGKIKANNVKDIKINNITNPTGFYGAADIDFDCDIDGEIEDFSFYSYMYGDEIESAPINIYHIYGTILNDLPDGETNFEDYLNNHMSELRDEIGGYLGKTDYVYGGGWSHSTFDGTISEKDSYLSDIDSYDGTIYCGDLMIGIDSIDAEITDEEIIKYVDEAVLGNNNIESYVVYDSDGDQSDDFEDLDSAIEYAKETNGTKVVKFYETQNFEGDIELDDSETVWVSGDDFDESLSNRRNKRKVLKENDEVNSELDSILSKEVVNYFNASNWFDKDKDGTFVYRYDPDYRDLEYFDETAGDILKSSNSLDSFYEKLDEDYREAIWQIEDEVEKEVYDYLIKKLPDEDSDTLHEWINDNLINYFYVNIDYSDFENYPMDSVLVLDAGDADYDFSLNPNDMTDMEELTIDDLEDESGLVWLTKSQGYTKEDLLDALKNGGSKTSKFLNSVTDEVYNSPSELNAITFLGKAPFKTLLSYNSNKPSITVTTDAWCGLYNNWNGGGSLLGIELEKPITISPKNIYEFTADESTGGYSIKDTYGMGRDAFPENAFKVGESIKESLKRNKKRALKEDALDDFDLNAYNKAHRYLGIPHTRVIDHGEWSDQKLVIYDRVFNLPYIEDILWGYYWDYCESNGIDPDKTTDEDFYKYVVEHEQDTILTEFYNDVEYIDTIDDTPFGESLKKNKNHKSSLKNIFRRKNKKITESVNKKNKKHKVLKEDFQEDMGRKIEKLARDNGVYATLTDGKDSVMGAFELEFVIHDGDWKHDHLAFNDIVKDFFNGNNEYSLWKIDEEEIGKSLSDSYSSYHTVYVVPKDKEELLNRMKVLFTENKKSNRSNKHKIEEDLQVTYETDLTDFEFWSGAKDTVEELTDAELTTISHILEDAYPDGMTETDINDLFWFERDTIAEWLGYDSFEELMNRKD